MGRPRLAVVVTHFGPVPVWLPAFLLSCRENPDVEWLIYTDIAVNGPVPRNVRIVPMQMAELNARSSDTLGVKVDVQPTFLKKLSDLKPAYGVIFADALREFDFWAYSELDIVWGDVRHFMTDELLAAHDLVSARHYKTAGHFTLFRNTAEMNHAFELIPDVRAAVSDPRHFRLDERALSRELRRLAPSLSPRIYWNDELTINAEYQRALPDGPGGNLWWCGGKTYDADGNELMYLHFHKLKSTMTRINFGYEDAPVTFMLNRAGVYRRATGRRNPDRRQGAQPRPGLVGARST